VPAEWALDITILDNGHLGRRFAPEGSPSTLIVSGALFRLGIGARFAVQELFQLVEPVHDLLLLGLQLLNIVSSWQQGLHPAAARVAALLRWQSTKKRPLFRPAKGEGWVWRNS
jgi:hypothetical protein